MKVTSLLRLPPPHIFSNPFFAETVEIDRIGVGFLPPRKYVCVSGGGVNLDILVIKKRKDKKMKKKKGKKVKKTKYFCRKKFGKKKCLGIFPPKKFLGGRIIHHPPSWKQGIFCPQGVNYSANSGNLDKNLIKKRI